MTVINEVSESALRRVGFLWVFAGLNLAFVDVVALIGVSRNSSIGGLNWAGPLALVLFFGAIYWIASMRSRSIRGDTPGHGSCLFP